LLKGCEIRFDAETFKNMTIVIQLTLKETNLKSRNLLVLVIVMGLILTISSNHVTAQISEGDLITKNINSAGALTIMLSSNNSVTLSLNDLKDMPKTIVNAELMCFGRPIKSGSWGGVQLGLLLEKAGLVESPESLKFYASDGYSIYVSNSYATQEDVIIAYELDGADLSETLRLVIPGANGESWISMITVISINTTTYVSSPNPQAAYIAVDPLQNIQSSPTQQPPQPSHTLEPKSQPTTQPTVPTPTNQPVQQQNSPNSNLKIDFGYEVLSGIIIVTALTTGYLFYTHKRRKN
jgi:hypothetical protein